MRTSIDQVPLSALEMVRFSSFSQTLKLKFRFHSGPRWPYNLDSSVRAFRLCFGFVLFFNLTCTITPQLHHFSSLMSYLKFYIPKKSVLFKFHSPSTLYISSCTSILTSCLLFHLPVCPAGLGPLKLGAFFVFLFCFVTLHTSTLILKWHSINV